MAPQEHPQRRFSDRDKELQRQYLITGPHKAIAAESGRTRQTITALANAWYPASAFLAADLAAIQQDLRFMAILAERAGGVLLPHRPKILTWSTMQLLATLALSFGRFFHLAQKVNHGKVLTDEEMREFDSNGEEIKITVDSMRERARRNRLKQSEDDTTPPAPTQYRRRSTDKE